MPAQAQPPSNRSVLPPAPSGSDPAISGGLAGYRSREEIRHADRVDASPEVTLLLCDDHVLFRDALTVLLQQNPTWRVRAEAGDGGEAVRLAAEVRPNVAVLDVAMPGLSGIDAAERIRETSPETRIVALSMYGDEYYRQGMSNAGAMAYVLKNEAGSELIRAIETVLRGEHYVSPVLRTGSALQHQRSVEVEKTKLTERERDVLRLMAQGRRTKEIARTLGLSPKTVETYRSRMALKIGAESLADLVKFAIRTGIVSIA